VIGFVSAQGGCGATSIACHVASAFERATQNDVLLADFDMECGLAGFLMQASTQHSVLDALRNLHRLDSDLWRAFATNTRPHLDVMPSPNGMPTAFEWEPAHMREVFRLVRSMYSWIVVDLGRTLNPVAMSVLDDLDQLFLVTTPRITSLFQAKHFVRRVVDAGYPRHKLRLILNRSHKSHGIGSDDLQGSLGIPLYAEIPERSELETAYTAGKLVSPQSDLGKKLSNLALRIAGLREERPKLWSAVFGSKKAQPGYARI
jgi:pilus assembly protein CpaE